MAGVPDPGVLPDNQPIYVMVNSTTVELSSFNASGPDVADDFTLPPADRALLENIPRNGAAFTIGCDAVGCPAGSGVATEVEIVTTDAPTAGLPPIAMPPPTGKRVVIRCAAIGTGSVTIPDAYAAYLMSANATRIQTTFRRIKFASPTPTDVSALAGHAMRGISN